MNSGPHAPHWWALPLSLGEKLLWLGEMVRSALLPSPWLVGRHKNPRLCSGTVTTAGAFKGRNKGGPPAAVFQPFACGRRRLRGSSQPPSVVFL